MQGKLAAFGLGVGLAVTGTSAAQSQLLAVPGSAPGERFGTALVLVPDLDGDGVAEIAVGSPFGGSGAGSLRVLSGASGALLLELVGPSLGSRFGAALCVLDDLDGDGKPDLAVGAPFANFPGKNGAGSVRIVSSASGALLLELGGDSAADHFGWALAALDDLDGDGRGELAIGAIDDDDAGPSSGSVRIVSSASGALLARRDGALAQELFGYALAAVGDLDGDGRRELLVGAPGFGGSSAPGRARLLSGATLALLREWTGAVPGDSFGGAVAALGDLDGDGAPDVLIGARQPTAGVFGYARVFSGGDGSLLLELPGDAQHSRWGSAVAGAGDVDNDGHADFLVGSPEAAAGGARAGAVRLHSGRDGSLLWEEHGAPGAQLGTALAGGLDLSGDGHPDVLLGAPFDSSAAPSAGLVLALRGSDSPLEDEEPQEPEERFFLRADRELVSLRAREGQRLFLDAGVENAGRRYLFLGSASGSEPGFDLFGTHVPLVPDRYMRLAVLCPRLPLAGPRGRLDDEGRAEAHFRPPPGLARQWVGRELHHAALILGAHRSPLLATNAVRVTIVP